MSTRKASLAIRLIFAGLAFGSALFAAVPVWRSYVNKHDAQKGVPFRKKFVSAYGLYRLVTGTRSCNGCVKLLKSDQLLMPRSKRMEMKREASKAAEFSAFCRTNGVRFVYVQLPKCLDVHKTMLPPGVVDFDYDNADDLLRLLASAGVETEDLRPVFAGTSEQVAANFYESDLHWNNLTSLRAAQYLVKEVLKSGEGDAEPVGRAVGLLDLGNWNQTVLGRYFFGANGTRTGRRFSKADDVTVLWPRFETDLLAVVPDRKTEVSGAFLKVAIPTYARAVSGGSSNGVSFRLQYAGGDNRFVRLINRHAPLKRKILLLGDSYSCSVRTYLWTVVGEIVAIDPRHRNPPMDIARLVLEERPDIVIQMHMPSALTVDSRAGEKLGRPAVFEYGL